MQPDNSEIRAEMRRIEAKIDAKIDATIIDRIEAKLEGRLENAITKVAQDSQAVERKIDAAAEKIGLVELRMVGHETRLEELIRKATELVTQLEFKPVKALVYSGTGIILTTVLAAVLSKVIMK